LKDNKGFTLLESIICIFILSIFCIFSLNTYREVNLDYTYFVGDYLLKQSESYLNKERINLDYGLSFNEMSHINKAMTIDFNLHDVIVHLGSGYITCE